MYLLITQIRSWTGSHLAIRLCMYRYSGFEEFPPDFSKYRCKLVDQSPGHRVFAEEHSDPTIDLVNAHRWVMILSSQYKSRYRVYVSILPSPLGQTPTYSVQTEYRTQGSRTKRTSFVGGRCGLWVRLCKLLTMTTPGTPGTPVQLDTPRTQGGTFVCQQGKKISPLQYREPYNMRSFTTIL